MYFNRIILVGRLTRDPELRTTPEGTSVVRFGLAVDRGTRQNEDTDFFDIIAFGTVAETVANYMTKGRLVLVEGRVQTRTYTASDGTRRKAWEVIASTVRFLEPRSVAEPTGAAAHTGPGEPLPDYEGITMEEEPTPSPSRQATPPPASTRSQPPRTSPATPAPDEEPDFDFDFDPDELTEEDPFQ